MIVNYKKVKLVTIFISILLFTATSFYLFIDEVYKLQFSDSEYYRNQAFSYREKIEIIEASRGAILDRNYIVMADNISSFNVGINPKKIKNIKEISELLSPLLNMKSNNIIEKIESSLNYFYLKRNVDFEVGEKIKNWNYDGINIEPSHRRIIYSSSMSKLIGQVDPDGNGIEGLELFFDNKLRGIDGKLRYEAAPNGDVIPQGEINTIDPVHGEDLILSLDSELQYIAENLCEEAITETGSYKCSVVFANAKTGQIIISAEKSSLDNIYFDINLISARASYEPGSALKIFTIGTLIDQGSLKEDDIFYVEDEIEIIKNSCQKLYKGLNGCFKDFLNHDPYELSVKEIIERSSNVGTIKITENTKIEDIESYLKKFGFGEKTGVELTGETKGSFMEYKQCLTCLSSISIGYSVNVSQYQIVRAYSIIANGGHDVKLSLIQKDKVEINNNPVISEDMSNRLKELLINVVEGDNGTGKSLRTEGYIIGGKTGTTRTHLEGVGYSDSRFNTSFTGFVETREGPIVGSILLWGANISQTSEYVSGGSTAAPIFKNIISYFIPEE
ncbi:MAG: hypothetical protein CMD88_05745 [Gammaproteobacteria bacterium]|nr:hypothetical protein [Gammaproteobacteria bacterium]